MVAITLEQRVNRLHPDSMLNQSEYALKTDHEFSRIIIRLNDIYDALT